MGEGINTLQKRRRIGFVASAMLCFLLFAGRMGQAQTVASGQTQPEKATPRFLKQPFQAQCDNMSLAHMAEMLRKSARVNIMIDGEPVLAKADFDFNGTLQEALDHVANTFDYNWAVTKTGVVLMTKRFKNPDEHPQANLPEMRQMAKDILEALRLAHCDPDSQRWKPMLETLAQSFTPAQRQALNTGQRLHGSDLAPDQYNLLQQAILTGSFADPIRLWEALSAKLEAMPDSYIQAKERSGPAAAEGQPKYDFFHVAKGRFGRWLITNMMHIVVQEGDKVIQ